MLYESTADAFQTQQLEITPERVLVNVVVATSLSEEKLRAAERLIIARTGKQANISARQVASQQELTMLREQLASPALAPPPAPQDIESMRKELLSRLEAPLKEAWPAELPPFTEYGLTMTPQGFVVRIAYESRKSLDKRAEGVLAQVLAQVLREKLKAQNLSVELERRTPRALRKGTDLCP